MASRFVDAGSVDEFISEQENKSTAKKIQRDVKLLQLFLVTKNEERSRNIEDIPTGELNEHTGENTSRLLFEVYFYIPANIIKDLVFEKTRKPLQSKQKELKKQGKLNKLNASVALTTSELNTQYEKSLLRRTRNPESLVFAVGEKLDHIA